MSIWEHFMPASGFQQLRWSELCSNSRSPRSVERWKGGRCLCRLPGTPTPPQTALSKHPRPPRCPS